MKDKVDIFFCYARKDKKFLEEIKTHLMPLQRLELAKVWHDADISPGSEWEEEISKHLNTADIILLLISPDFMASEYCYSKEMVQAMERHERGEARVIPVILRAIYWQEAPFGKLQALPKDAQPITKWQDRDEALFDVAETIRMVVQDLISSWEHARVQTEQEKPPPQAKKRMDFLPGGKVEARPLHFIWIIDRSSSMKGDKIQSLNTAIREIIPQMRRIAQSNPYARLMISTITTGAQWRLIQRPTSIENFQWTDIAARGKRDIGQTLSKTAEFLKAIHIGKHTFPPVLVLISDGHPADDFEEGLRALLAQPWGRKAVRLAVGIGNYAPYELFQQFIGNPEIEPLQASNAEQLVNYIQWASEIVTTSSSSPLDGASHASSYEEVESTLHPEHAQKKQDALPLHLIWIVDCSNLMEGANIQALNVAIREVLPTIQSAARLHPQTQILSQAIAFSTGIRWHIAQPTPIEDFRWKDVAASGESDMGAALFEVAEQLDRLEEAIAPPMLILLSVGYPSDSFEAGLQALLAHPKGKKAVRLAVGIGLNANYPLLEKFTGNPKITPLSPYNLENLVEYIQWNDNIREEKENDLEIVTNYRSITTPTTMLRRGQMLRTASGMTCKVQELLGEGGQGEVYRALLADQQMALKWYYSQTATREQLQAIEVLVKKGPPNAKFLWPLELVYQDGTPQFGYLMPLRPANYKSIVDLMKRRIDPTFRELTIAGRQLADSYFQLHVSGLCYRDISFGNVFFEPTNGEVMICDNDNVTVNGTTGGVLGTSRFMAPEIVRGEALPSTQADRFSLAVLLFYIFMFHHPLEGKREVDIHIFDQAAMTKVYGTDPLFIFDPHDNSNAPVKGYHDNPLIFWSIYPQFLRDLFTRAFTDGLKDPENGRVLESEWRSAMVRLHDSIFYCAHCNSQNFYDIDALRSNGGTPPLCWNCKERVILPYRIRIEGNTVMLNYDTKLYPHHVDRQKRWDFTKPVALVNRHPTDPSRWGLKNVSAERWVVIKPDGTKQDVAVGQNAPLAADITIDFGNRIGRLYY